MRYEIVEAESPEALTRKVNERLAGGWELYGDFTVVNGKKKHSPLFLQPMTFQDIDRGFPLKKRGLRIA